MIDRLSPTDVELLRAFSRGERLHETADRLSYSYGWARQRRAELIRKLEAMTMGEAFARALALGLYTEEVARRG